MLRIFLADNNDSFTRNLEHLLMAATMEPDGSYGATVTVVPYGELAQQAPATSACSGHHLTHGQPCDLPYDLLVISPGPGHPQEYPAYVPYLEHGIPVLGICMGMQIINAFFGGTTKRTPAILQRTGQDTASANATTKPATRAGHGCMHGKTDTLLPAPNSITTSPLDTFTGTPVVARYHSLSLATIGEGLQVTTRNAQGTPMSVQHATRPIAGYQFHPESFMTHNGTHYIDYALRLFSLR